MWIPHLISCEIHMIMVRERYGRVEARGRRSGPQCCRDNPDEPGARGGGTPSGFESRALP